MLDTLFGRLQSARLVIVATFRPEFQPPWPERLSLTRIPLARLSTSQATALVGLTSVGRTLQPEAVAQLVGRSDGIPLFIEELTRAVAESAGSPTIPASLNELLLARLDKLTGAGKEAAQLGAVIGREFTYSSSRRIGRRRDAQTWPDAVDGGGSCAPPRAISATRVMYSSTRSCRRLRTDR